MFFTEEEIDGVAVQIEVVFDFDDDNSLEVTYLAFAEDDVVFDLTHLLAYELGGEVFIEDIDSKAPVVANYGKGIMSCAMRCNIPNKVLVVKRYGD